jgi:hypothetical protein
MVFRPLTRVVARVRVPGGRRTRERAKHHGALAGRPRVSARSRALGRHPSDRAPGGCRRGADGDEAAAVRGAPGPAWAQIPRAGETPWCVGGSTPRFRPLTRVHAAWRLGSASRLRLTKSVRLTSERASKQPSGRADGTPWYVARVTPAFRPLDPGAGRRRACERALACRTLSARSTHRRYVRTRRSPDAAWASGLRRAV